MALPSYSTGTVSIDASGTTVIGSGSIWTGGNAREGDDLVIDGILARIVEVVSATELTITKWVGDAVSGSQYVIYQNASRRFDDVQIADDLRQQVGALNTEGFYHFVKPGATEPDPSLGDEGQYAFQADTGKVWQKVGGLWSFVGVYKGINPRGPYNAGAAYGINDAVSSGGSAYMAIAPTTGNAPPNPTYWMELGTKGDKGEQGDRGKGYGGTSLTAVEIGLGGKVFATQAELAYQVGGRVRATSTADPTKWMDGVVFSYSETGEVWYLGITVSKISGAGNYSDWSFNVTGEPAVGDMLSANNASEYAGHEAAVLSNLGGTPFGQSIFTATDAAIGVAKLRDGTDVVVDVYMGQSNAAMTYEAPGLVFPPNLVIWSSLGAAGDVGSTFINPNNAPKHGWAYAAAARKARENPLTKFYVIINAAGSNPVEQWVPGYQQTGTGLYDMAASLEANLAAALPLTGKTTIDNMHCWVGESNAYEASTEAFFKGLWEQLHIYWRGRSWFPYSSPIFAMGYSPFDAAFPPYTRYMREWCEAQPQVRNFVDTSHLTSSHWTPVPHMSADGYEAAGAALYNAVKGRGVQIYEVGTITPTASFDTPGDMVFNPIIANGGFIRIGRLVTFHMFFRTMLGYSTASGDFRIAGLPYPADGIWPCQVSWPGTAINPAGFTQLDFLVQSGQNYGKLFASGPGKDARNLSVADVPQGQTFDFWVSGQYLTE